LDHSSRLGPPESTLPAANFIVVSNANSYSGQGLVRVVMGVTAVFLCEFNWYGFRFDEIRYNKRMTDTLAGIKSRLQAQKPYLYEKYGVTEIGVFGSYVRGEQRPDSDIDILVDLTDPPRISLLDLVDLQYYLSDLLGMEVDVAVKGNLRKRIGRRILSEVQPV
jgi:predicted nucleotidyltransferase